MLILDRMPVWWVGTFLLWRFAALIVGGLSHTTFSVYISKKTKNKNNKKGNEVALKSQDQSLTAAGVPAVTTVALPSTGKFLGEQLRIHRVECVGFICLFVGVLLW